MYCLMAAAVLGTAAAWAQKPDPISEGVGAVVSVAGEVRTAADSVSAAEPTKPVPMWKKKLYYGYNFDIYFHHDSKANTKENGWSIAIEPEIGWKLKERVYLGMRVGGSFQDTYATYSYLDPLNDKTYTEDLRVMRGTWEVTPYMRYRLKSMFNDKLGIWLEAHLYAGMEFPRVADGTVKGTDYEGLKHSVTYGAQVSPVITYQFNRRSTFQIFFSILSFGYSGTTRFYEDPEAGPRREYSNDIIIFSGKLSNLIANQLTPGLYGLRFGVQKSF
jgi:hypothetical protein